MVKFQLSFGRSGVVYALLFLLRLLQSHYPSRVFRVQVSKELDGLSQGGTCLRFSRVLLLSPFIEDLLV